ncbi:MAG: DNA-deoxyinosine glycosylase [Burkholderiales bacterium]|nr:DNA-deoxyinosine glycosylase [Burkholderiales bacterium]
MRAQPSPPTTSPVLSGLAPVWSPQIRLLILGSFPSVASLAQQQYYAHPRNHFWPILSAIWGLSGPQALSALPYADRLAVVRDKGLGIWDVYASCEREGSLDSDIQRAQLNDLAGLIQRSPALQAIAHNGGESARHMRITRQFGLPVLKLPSSSPANATWSFEKKLAAWRDAFAQVGLI